MYIRCKQCHGLVQILLEQDRDRPSRARCPTCGRKYALKLSGNMSAMEERLLTRARAIALEHEIDLPGAYSVLIGVMDLEQVRALLEQPPSVPAEAVAEAAADAAADAGQPRSTRYDPAFREAVEAGLLTPLLAFERGKREAWAARLADKHHLTMEAALDVADNRMSLLGATRAQKTRESEPVRLQVSATAPRSRVAPLLAVAGLAAMVFLALFATKSTPVESAVQDGAVRIQNDSEGRIVRIEGPDADSVLAAYCESGDPRREFRPLGLRPSARNEPAVAMGILKDSAAPQQQLAIYISRDPSRRRWTAGNGRSPLVAFQAPAQSGIDFRSVPPTAPGP